MVDLWWISISFTTLNIRVDILYPGLLMLSFPSKIIGRAYLRAINGWLNSLALRIWGCGLHYFNLCIVVIVVGDHVYLSSIDVRRWGVICQVNEVALINIFHPLFFPWRIGVAWRLIAECGIKFVFFILDLLGLDIDVRTFITNWFIALARLKAHEHTLISSLARLGEFT